MPLIYVGGVMGRENAETALAAGFDFVQIGHALVRDTEFVNKMREEQYHSECKRSNYCVARMYTLDMKCHECDKDIPAYLKREALKYEQMWYPEKK